MRNAETILAIIRERGRRGLPLERVYRHLFNRELYLRAYGRIARNNGAMTPGVSGETADGMSLAKIDAIIDALRHERYRWKPARRVYIEKPSSSKKRPLGIPSWSDKLLQEVIRSILESYFEPQFSPTSHGFRPDRGCHTALREIHRKWNGTTWFIEGDISECFDKLDHSVLLSILGENIHDNRFLRLIENLLKAGYLEEWRFNVTPSGTPQGGVVSPLLSNIYLDRLDKFVDQTLHPKHNQGTKRKPNLAYNRLANRVYYLVKTGRRAEAQKLRKQMKQMPSTDPNDPEFRRLRYVRYADDFLLGFIGPRKEAEEIKATLAEFLRETLKLELSEIKTLITHARTSAAHFLGYEVVVHQNNTKHTNGRRAINGVVGLKVPVDVVRAKCSPYLKNGKPIHRSERVNDSVHSVITQYQTEYRGVVNYYQMAYNLHQLQRLKWIMEESLVRTLAMKLKISVRQVYRRFQTTLQTDEGPRKVLQITVRRSEGKKPLVARWGGIPLVRREDAILKDEQAPRAWNDRTELIQRLLAESCERCGSRDNVEVHHVRHLKDLQRKGRGEKPYWIQIMAARQRKTLVVCAKCHDDIHAGRRPTLA